MKMLKTLAMAAFICSGSIAKAMWSEDPLAIAAVIENLETNIKSLNTELGNKTPLTDADMLRIRKAKKSCASIKKRIEAHEKELADDSDSDDEVYYENPKFLRAQLRKCRNLLEPLVTKMDDQNKSKLE